MAGPLTGGRVQAVIRRVKKLPLLPLIVVLGLCAAVPSYAGGSHTKLTEHGDNTYSYTREAATTFNRDVEQLTAEAKEDAAKYCAAKGKQAKVVSIVVNKPWYTLGFATATVTFKALEAGDPELASAAPVPVVNARKKTKAPPVVVPPAPPAPVNDLYADLLKLDDLRKKGILTDEEFQAEKKKVLSRSK